MTFRGKNRNISSKDIKEENMTTVVVETKFG